MLRKLLKKRTVLALSVVAVLALAGGAYAFLSSTGSGSGSGSATIATSGLNITFSQPAFTALPQTQTVTIYATNTASNAEQFNSLTNFSVGSATGSGCPDGSFTNAAAPATTAQEIPADGQPHQIGTVDVSFNDLAVPQNSCLGSDTAAYSASSN